MQEREINLNEITTLEDEFVDAVDAVQDELPKLLNDKIIDLVRTPG